MKGKQKVKKFFRSTYDGNVKEWFINEEVQYASGVGPEAALHSLCAINQVDEDFVGPQRFFGDANLFVLVCGWTMGREVWPHVIALHTEPKTIKELQKVFAKNKVVLEDEE